MLRVLEGRVQLADVLLHERQQEVLKHEGRTLRTHIREQYKVLAVKPVWTTKPIAVLLCGTVPTTDTRWGLKASDLGDTCGLNLAGQGQCVDKPLSGVAPATAETPVSTRSRRGPWNKLQTQRTHSREGSGSFAKNTDNCRLVHQHQNKQLIAPGEKRLSDGLKGTQSAVNYPVS